MSVKIEEKSASENNTFNIAFSKIIKIIKISP